MVNVRSLCRGGMPRLGLSLRWHRAFLGSLLQYWHVNVNLVQHFKSLVTPNNPILLLMQGQKDTL